MRKRPNRHRTRTIDRTYTWHHLLCKSRWWTNEPENLSEIKDTVHRSIHILFCNDTFPEQIRRLIEINQSTLQGDFIQDINRILDLYKGLEYHDGIKKKD